MEPNEDIAAPDMDTVEMPAAAPNPAPEQPDALADDVVDTATIEDAETTILEGVGATDRSDISSEDTIQFAAMKPDVETVERVDDDVALADTMVETPAVLMPVVRDTPRAQSTTHAQSIRNRIAQIPLAALSRVLAGGGAGGVPAPLAYRPDRNPERSGSTTDSSARRMAPWRAAHHRHSGVYRRHESATDHLHIRAVRGAQQRSCCSQLSRMRSGTCSAS